MESIRLNKIISHNTTYSRRDADKLIQEGKIKVDGKVVTDLSTKVNFKDNIIKINEKKLFVKSKFSVIIYNKQKGEIVSKKDDRNRKTIYDTISGQFRHYIPVGRLDYASEGLLIMSDSSKLVSLLMSSSMERVYYLKIKGPITEEMQKAMKTGLTLADATKGAHALTSQKSMEFKPFVAYNIIKNTSNGSKIKVAISEGQNRELRRFFAHFDADVTDLKRVSFGGIDLGMLKPGKTRFLENNEYQSLHTFLEKNDFFNY
ncbi:MAG: Ribosomal large subunit pseudouridine synthase B (EC [uncultured Campylobacterales bacterium]|uniref:Pseudouridine synthase n=1 Tax=uncultured Campylobacterales bacterium TaxID=352960 RepID=A0A6S6SJH3_9BACT|nr:MAG: Ribosomal large subunit pseudouridine synthase B (EC [uncultured Campylobacterales bacterium]